MFLNFFFTVCNGNFYSISLKHKCSKERSRANCQTHADDRVICRDRHAPITPTLPSENLSENVPFFQDQAPQGVQQTGAGTRGTTNEFQAQGMHYRYW